MDLNALLNDQSVKPVAKREALAAALEAKTITMQDIQALGSLDDRKTSVILEAMEAVTRSAPALAGLSWLEFAQQHITAGANSLKRESSRVVGNIAHLFPASLGPSIEKLLENAATGGTVVRWGSAYALARIISTPQYAGSPLFDKVNALAQNETENGVKNQYLGGLKKAQKLRGSK